MIACKREGLGMRLGLTEKCLLTTLMTDDTSEVSINISKSLLYAGPQPKLFSLVLDRLSLTMMHHVLRNWYH